MFRRMVSAGVVFAFVIIILIVNQICKIIRKISVRFFDTTIESYPTIVPNKILKTKNLKLKAKGAVSAEDEWAHLTETENKDSKTEDGIGSKIDSGEANDVLDRSVTFKEKEFKTKEEKYKKKSEDFKDNFGTTAQYLKFVNAHIAEKTSKLDKLKQDKEKFEQDLASLNPVSKKNPR